MKRTLILVIMAIALQTLAQSYQRNSATTNGPPITLNVTDYGASTNLADNGPAFTAAAVALGDALGYAGYMFGGKGGRITIPPGTYQFQTSWEIPRKWAQVANADVDGYGATLKTTNAIPIINRWPTNNDELEFLSAHMGFRGIRFVGSGIANQTAIKIGGANYLRINNCDFDTITNGVDAYQAFESQLHDCTFNFSTIRLNPSSNYFTGIGWSGGFTNAGGCNHSEINNCRWVCATAQPYALAVYSSSGVRVLGCVFEGNNPVIDVLVEGAWGNIGNFRMVDTHWENTPSDSFLKVNRLSRATVTVNGITGRSAIMINATNSDTPIFNVMNLQYADAFPLFDASTRTKFDGTLGQNGTTGWVWNFENCTGLAGANFIDPKWWVSGVVPTNISVRGAGQNSLTTLGMSGNLDATGFITSSNGFYSRNGVGFRSVLTGNNTVFAAYASDNVTRYWELDTVNGAVWIYLQALGAYGIKMGADGVLDAVGFSVSGSPGISKNLTLYTKDQAGTGTITNVITIIKGIITGWTP